NERWSEVVSLRPRLPSRTPAGPVDVVVVHRGSREALSRCLSALERQSHADLRVTVAEGASVEAARAAGRRAGTAPYIVFLDEEDVPDDDLLETLLRARSASGADVVTCGLRLAGDRERPTLQLFSGEPRGLGLLSNDYGTVAL